MRKIQDLIRELRGNYTQEQIAEKIGVSRETFSRYETGKIDLPTTAIRKLSEKFDNPKFNMQLQSNYIGTGPVWLDGPNADLHRSAVKEKTLEELQEAFEQLKNTSLVKPLKNLAAYEVQNVQNALEELVEAQTAIDHLIAVVCMEAGISYTGLWSNHYRALASAGYIRGGIQ